MIEIVISSSGKKELYRRALQSIKNQKNCGHSHFVSTMVTLFNADHIKAIQQSSAEWVLVLNENCHIPNENYISNLKKLIQEHPKVTIWGGLYLSSDSEKYLVRAYNNLCNFWVLISRSKNQVLNYLNGCLAIHVPTVKPILEKNASFQGSSLIGSLEKSNLICCLSKKLSVVHQPFAYTLKTLWIKTHEYQENRHDPALPLIPWDGIVYGFRNFIYWPVWVLHFAILMCAIFRRKYGRVMMSMRTSNKSMERQKSLSLNVQLKS